MLTVIDTNDGRLLITDRKDIKAVIKEAQEDLVDIGELGDNDIEESTRAYILVEQGYLRVDEACRP